MSRYSLEPLADTFGAKIVGIDLRDPLDRLTAERMVSDLHTHRLLVIPDQPLSHVDHVNVSRVFGQLETHILDQYAVDGFPEIVKISNIFNNGVPIGIYDGDNEEEWHTDHSWKQTTSAASLLHSAIAPAQGGATRFADTTTAYDDLSEAVKHRIDGLTTVHSMIRLFERQAAENPDKVALTDHQRARVPDVTHPLVRVHPVTGRRSLLLGSMIISGILGMDDAVAEELLSDLLAYATGERYVYAHQWARDDLVIWDNRATMHTASPCDHRRHRRLLYRTTVF